MTKQKIIIITSISLAVLLISTMLLLFLFSSNYMNTEFLEIMDLAISENNSQICTQITNPEEQNLCIENVEYNIITTQALIELNTSLCNELQQSNLEQLCLDDIHLRLSQTTNNQSYCELITSPTLRQICFN